jgi:prophage antirepressor-like protein
MRKKLNSHEGTKTLRFSKSNLIEADMETTKIAVFKGKEVRKTIHNNEWWFVIEDVVFALTDSKDPKQYINRLRKRDEELAKGWVQFVHTLLVETDGGPQKVNCANTEGIFRIIQSIPSPKAEPFKRWLAKVGYERVQEIENPELATTRTRDLYKAKGYSDNWIEKRMRGIAIREELTDEWKNRGVKEQAEYAILTAEITKATFGLTPSQYKQLKGLKRENLRDHMNDLELIFSMLGEAATTEITRDRDAQGFSENKDAAVEGGEVAGKARKDLESRTKKKVVSGHNYLQQPENKKLIKGKVKNVKKIK